MVMRLLGRLDYRHAIPLLMSLEARTPRRQLRKRRKESQFSHARYGLEVEGQCVAEELLAAQILEVQVSTQRAHSTSSDRLKVCLRIASPAISRVGSGGMPGPSE